MAAPARRRRALPFLRRRVARRPLAWPPGHADAELERTTTITGRPVSGIAADARPGAASVAGFVAEDEDLLALIRGDNDLVARLGLTHPELAKTSFEVFNLLLRDLELARRGEVRHY